MAAAFRTLGSIAAAMLATLVLLVAVEFFSSIVHPLPADFDETSMEEMCQHVERYPDWVLAVVVPAWAGIAFVGTWIAGRLGNLGSALVIGLLLLGAAIFNISMLPYPTWFKVISLIAIPAAIAGGVYFSNLRQTAAINIIE